MKDGLNQLFWGFFLLFFFLFTPWRHRGDTVGVPARLWPVCVEFVLPVDACPQSKDMLDRLIDQSVGLRRDSSGWTIPMSTYRGQHNLLLYTAQSVNVWSQFKMKHWTKCGDVSSNCSFTRKEDKHRKTYKSTTKCGSIINSEAGRCFY